MEEQRKEHTILAFANENGFLASARNDKMGSPFAARLKPCPFKTGRR
jgi:hypothetical protein